MADSAGVRQRFLAEKKLGSFQDLQDEDDPKQYRKAEKEESLGLAHLVAVVFFFCVLTSVLRFAARNLPEPDAAILSNETRFSAIRARKYLEGITKFGPRTAGSYENDILAVEYILGQLERIKKTASGVYNMDIETQHPSGGFQLYFLNVHFSESYENLTNIIVHLYPKERVDDEVLLVNSHFDTQTQTDGASDATASCALMLEMLSCLSKSPAGTLRHGIVFLFNGAEESILPGSHGFITQHPLAGKVKAFLNLEASGSGGKELVFQTGPDHPWLIHVYGQSAVRPHASIVAQEIFQAGLVPSDTDFRIFRDFGSVPGIDVAFTDNGYVYHTKHDTADIIPDSSLQHSGENMLALVKSLTSSQYLKDSTSFSKGNMVFFDVAGSFMVLYSHTIAETVNMLVATLAILYVGYRVMISRNYEAKKELFDHVSFSSIGGCFLVTITSWIVGLALVLLIAAVVSATGHSLSWYSKPKFIVFLYGLPYLTSMLIIHRYGKHTMIKAGICSKSHAGFQLERSAVYSYFLFLSILLIILTLQGLLSAAFILFNLLFPLAFNGPLHDYLVSKQSIPKRKVVTIACHLIGFSFPCLMTLHIVSTSTSVFIPILGRAGSIIPPDLIAAAGMFGMAVGVSQYLTGLLYLTNFSVKSLMWWITVSLLPMALVIVGIVFPFSGIHPVTPKRFAMQHVLRNFHDASGNIDKTDSMLWITPFDYLGIAPLDSVPGFTEFKPYKECSGAYCGMPSIFPLLTFFKETWYLDAPPPLPGSPISVRFLPRQKVNDKVRVYLEVDGPARMNLYLKLKPNVTLSKWSFVDVEVLHLYDSLDDPCYFVIHTGGYYHSVWKFWLEFTVLDQSSKELTDLGIGSHYLQGEHAVTPTIAAKVAQMPNWVTDMSWVSAYDHWTI